ncbi:hypothetical protein D1007_58958 [Hordeum vulgare]|uniref:Predicted protein n=1 Tax=Hordeum vulgare subsp. vulgare TaxID=112509 RepID=F2DXW3_HORVV|nr:uncharacterized protein LOC123443699 [Hordeum vulgare subsp. vulgare]KAE8769454.1 hypothetical protein D1007_58958 [Hordeum vulgare]BAJ99934.1 predicted protein [Hordeum vulgare subsp. vulgare]
MLPTLLGGYLTVSALPLPLPTATATPRTRILPGLRPSSRLVARRSAGETVHATATEEEEQEWKELQEEGLPRRGQHTEDDHDHDPEIADIMGDYFDDPKKAQSRMEERIKKKRHKIVQAKTGSPNPMNVVFNKFDFSNSYIWFEFHNALLPKDVKLICDALRSWHILGRLGGCNSMNMQLSQLSLDCKRPTYDALKAANATPTSFYNIGDLEIQENLARVWVDIGIQDPLLLDVLLNSLATINSDHLGIKEIQFGGSEFQSWNDSLNTEEAGYSVHKI